MELLHVLRALVRMRLLVCAGLLFATAIGLILSFRVSLLPPKLESRKTLTGLAAARVQLDTAPTIVVSGEPDDFPVLQKQAGLLADLLASHEAEADIARRAGVSDVRLLVVGPSRLRPVMPSPLAVSASEAAAFAPEPYLLQIDTTESIPFLTFAASAPTVAAARRLAEAGIASITSARTRLGTPGGQRLVVRRLGPTRVAEKWSGSKVPLGAAAGFVVFGTWCAGLVILSGLVRRWRRAEAPAVPALK